MSTSPFRELYAVLGLAPDATPGQITRAYHAQVRQHHPDTRAEREPDQDSDAALQEVFAAYAVLRTPACRAAYDRAARPQPKLRPRPIPIRARSRGLAPAPSIRAGPVRWWPR